MNLMHADNPFKIPINSKNFLVKEPLIMYIDEKPHELSMKRLTAGVIAVIVVVVVAIVAGIVVLVSHLFTAWGIYHVLSMGRVGNGPKPTKKLQQISWQMISTG
ncbi:hypothetical protein GDO81_029823 [Engystomops pustulosus]|uniref:Uncharacterized protein n=1 Tax=Engystomops pustulosus TaxID=76066 RepID=A0AAV6YIB3_ENGPU|nr:hypothetical protein GDO81_029823 [Engystomops pustulosus]